MLFNDDELNRLTYFKDTAQVFNNIYLYYQNNNLDSVILGGSNLEVNYFFRQIKNNFNYLDSLFKIIQDLDSDKRLYKISAEINEALKQYWSSYSRLFLNLESFMVTITTCIFNFFNTIVKYPLLPEDEDNNYELADEFKHFVNYLGVTLNEVNTLHQSYDSRLNTLEDSVNQISNQHAIHSSQFDIKVDEFISEQKSFFDKNVQNIIRSFRENIQYVYENDLKGKISELIDKFDNNKYELDSLLGDVKLYQDKMTNKAVSEMSAHYFNKSVFERNSYFIITFLSAVIIIFSVVSAYRGVNSYYNQYVSTEACDKNEVDKTQGTIIPPVKLKSYEECMKDLTIKREATQKYAFNYLIFRLSFSLLLFLAVIYASRIAMRAYNHWRQSENMYLKLNTLSPFIGSLDKSVRNDVHLSLVPDYFGKDAGMVENSKDAVKDIPTNISNIAIKAIEQAGSTLGSKLGSDKESKNSDSEPSTEKNGKKPEGWAE
jgi:hypothetical protein